ncbi:IS21-like element helper ATPase IstB [Pseudomonas tohonis]|uniref:IS21-like element helper ATPase IstB n=1 Tax=Pseudomonas tohonis TaxID=2725477 RepID=UPI0021D9979E|nr:IS21-like element helper ATPase IstB [Pseudomonas tohonis]UXY54045.1 IS21-like element helper ATPase IstB [Pseudomonas tohonis]
MNEQQTIEQLQALKLFGMASAMTAQLESPGTQSLPFSERIALLVEAECHDRDNRRQRRLMAQAKLKMRNACLEDIDYRPRRGLDKSQLLSLGQCQWIERHQHLLITGPTGVGKTWLACAFGMQAIRRGYSVAYHRVSRLLEETEIARADGSLSGFRSRLAKCQLLILDDWGMSPLSDIGRQDLLEFVDDRTGAGAILIASQLPVAKWYEYINEPTLADAILDRIVHRAHKIEMRGDSMRKKHGLEGGED